MICRFIGIDLGQSNTCASVRDNASLSLYTETQPDGRYPTQLFFEKDKVQYGSMASAGGNRDPLNFVKGWKQFVGTDKKFVAGGTERTPLEMCALMFSLVAREVLEGENLDPNEV
ncbi:MAG: Hsp70 family protein [Candidatus Methanomethylophilaceae archaeon]|nr:Hsp70 family protein [Candidatus Methanomethylophilaceae archaeon]